MQPRRAWAKFWMQFAGHAGFGRVATRMAEFAFPPYKGRQVLARLSEKGYVASTARVAVPNLKLGKHVFIGDDVMLFSQPKDTRVELGDEVYIHKGTIIEMGAGGSVAIGARTHIQPRCQFAGYLGSISIGEDVQIAPGCGFYPYNHRMAAGVPMRHQPLETKGGIVIEDDVWLGYGVIALDGARIGAGAVIGAGSIVTGVIPAGAIAVGSPARVVRQRPNDIADVGYG